MDPVVLRAKLKRNLPLIFSLFFLMVGMGVGLFLIGQTQIFKKQAAGVCPVEGAVCQWDYSTAADAVTFQYEIVDLTTGETVKKGTSQTTRITFTPLADHQYSCKVTPQTVCGLGAEKIALNTCTAEPTPTTTPTLPLTPTQTPTPTATGTPGPSPTPSATGTPGPSPTPTVTSTPELSPTLSATSEPSPTSAVSPTSTEGNVGTGTPTPTQAVGAPAPTSTPTPLAGELPESAAIGPTFYLLIFGILLVVSGTRLLL